MWSGGHTTVSVCELCVASASRSQTTTPWTNDKGQQRKLSAFFVGGRAGSWRRSLAGGWQKAKERPPHAADQRRAVGNLVAGHAAFGDCCWQGQAHTPAPAVAATARISRQLPRLSSGPRGFSLPPDAPPALAIPPEPPDLLHAHNLHGGYFDLRQLAEFSRQLPCVVTLRDEWLLTGHCAYTGSCQRWADGLRAVPRPQHLSRRSAATRPQRTGRSNPRSTPKAGSLWLHRRAGSSMKPSGRC